LGVNGACAVSRRAAAHLHLRCESGFMLTQAESSRGRGGRGS
jgi:hypothetical protein